MAQWSQHPSSRIFCVVSSPLSWPSNLLLINRIQQMCVSHFQGWFKSLIPPCSFSFALSLVWSDKTNSHVLRCSVERPVWQGTKGSLKSATHEDLRSQSNSLLGNDPANNCAGKLGRRSFPGEPWGDDNIVRDPEREKARLSITCISNPKQLWDNKWCCLKPLNFGIIYYIAK